MMMMIHLLSSSCCCYCCCCCCCCCCCSIQMTWSSADLCCCCRMSAVADHWARFNSSQLFKVMLLKFAVFIGCRAHIWRVAWRVIFLGRGDSRLGQSTVAGRVRAANRWHSMASAKFWRVGCCLGQQRTVQIGRRRCIFAMLHVRRCRRRRLQSDDGLVQMNLLQQMWLIVSVVTMNVIVIVVIFVLVV